MAPSTQARQRGVTALARQWDGRRRGMVDFMVRHWPADAAPYEPGVFEDDYRAVLRELADAGKALEVNTNIPSHPQIIRWWHQEGGETVSFGSDAHDPTALAHGFQKAAAMVEDCGFGPGRHPDDYWTRS